ASSTTTTATTTLKSSIKSDPLENRIRLADDLKFFLITAPANWQEHQIIRRYYLNHDEGFISCVFWKNLYFITGTDIVKCITYRFKQFGRDIIDRKKFEEGIFSDLRNLKCGNDAVLEPPKSEFLQFLHKNNCLRTQKKQKVFFWFSVPHDKLFSDALERDLKRE
ncbi:STE domain-containing protein, partial [Ascoidea rubescens DSM 1968]